MQYGLACWSHGFGTDWCHVLVAWGRYKVQGVGASCCCKMLVQGWEGVLLDVIYNVTELEGRGLDRASNISSCWKKQALIVDVTLLA